MSVHYVVNFQAAAGHGDQLGALLAEGRDISRRSDGCESFELFRWTDQPERFTFLERWTTLDAHRANMSAIVGIGHMAKIVPLLAHPTDNGPLDLVE